MIISKVFLTIFLSDMQDRSLMYPSGSQASGLCLVSLLCIMSVNMIGSNDNEPDKDRTVLSINKQIGINILCLGSGDSTCDCVLWYQIILSISLKKECSQSENVFK